MLPAARMGASSRASPLPCVPGGTRSAGCGLRPVGGPAVTQMGVTRSCGIVRRVVPTPVVPGPAFGGLRSRPGRVPRVVRRWATRRTVRLGWVVVKPKTTTCSGVVVVRIATCRYRRVSRPAARGPRTAPARPHPGDGHPQLGGPCPPSRSGLSQNACSILALVYAVPRHLPGAHPAPRAPTRRPSALVRSRGPRDPGPTSAARPGPSPARHRPQPAGPAARRSPEPRDPRTASP